MSSPSDKFLDKTPRFRAAGLPTPDSEGIAFKNPDYGDGDPETPDLPTERVQQKPGQKITPKTVAPKHKKIQRERENTGRTKNVSRLLDSPGGSNSGGSAHSTPGGDIVLNLYGNAEDMTSSEIRRGSRGLLANPSSDDDVFVTSSVQGNSVHWMKGYNKREGFSSIVESRETAHGFKEEIVPGIDNDTPTKIPRKQNLSGKKLGIQFPNFGRFWGAKYNWEEVRCTSMIQMFAKCDPEDADRVKELYKLAWLIKVSIAVMQCDIEDQARVQEIVRWAQDIKNENDWQRPIPLGWNLKQQQYIGPVPSDEERQRFVDYAWLMDHNKASRAWDAEKEKEYNEAIAVVFEFKEKYPDFPHDYPLGYPSEHTNRRINPLEAIFGGASDYGILLKEQETFQEDEVEEDTPDEMAQTPMKRKHSASGAEGVSTEEPITRKRSRTLTKGVDSERKAEHKVIHEESLRRSGRNHSKGTINYKS